MPAETLGPDRQTIRPVHDQRRRSERRSCHEAAIMRSPRGDFSARILNLSADGCGVRIDTMLPLKPGDRLLLIHLHMGEVPCVLRWAMHPHYGAEFMAGLQAKARIQTYYDTLAPAAGEIA